MGLQIIVARNDCLADAAACYYLATKENVSVTRVGNPNVPTNVIGIPGYQPVVLFSSKAGNYPSKHLRVLGPKDGGRGFIIPIWVAHLTDFTRAALRDYERSRRERLCMQDALHFFYYSLLGEKRAPAPSKHLRL